MKTRTKVGAAALLVIGAALLGHRLGTTPARALDESTIYLALAAGRIESVSMRGDGIGWKIRGRWYREPLPSGDRSVERFTAYVLAEPGFSILLRESGIPVEVEQRRRISTLFLLLIGIFLLLCLVVALAFMLRLSRSGGRIMALRKSRAKRFAGSTPITFADVAGIEEAKHELQEIVEFLKQPQRFQALGGRIPSGVLLVGPPGTGKTLLARAVAGEAGTAFLSMSGSDFVEMYVGLGAARVRDLFERGRKLAPCIIFVDELDAVGRMRGTGVGGGHDEREQTLNQLLVELDGFESHDGVVVLAATNRPDVLDAALLRPGRFDRQVVIDRPDVRGREQILGIHTRNVPLGADVELGVLARMTPGFSGADLANLVNEAALHAAVLRRESVSQDDFEGAKDKALMGTERRSTVISADERRAMAYHEAGHALMAHLLPEADPLYKVTIVPRGLMRGTTQQIPTDDRHIESRPSLLAAICVLLGGRAAEELRLNRVSSGAGADLDRTTRLARRMVTEWGMSESLGPMGYGKPVEPVFLGRDLATRRDYSDATAAEIDREVKHIIVDCYEKARRILEERTDALTRVAEALLVHETLVAGQVVSLIQGES